MNKDLFGSRLTFPISTHDKEGNPISVNKRVRALAPEDLEGNEELKAFVASTHAAHKAKRFTEALPHLKKLFHYNADGDNHDVIHATFANPSASIDDFVEALDKVKDHHEGVLKDLPHQEYSDEEVHDVHRMDKLLRTIQYTKSLLSNVKDKAAPGSLHKPVETKKPPKIRIAGATAVRARSTPPSVSTFPNMSPEDRQAAIDKNLAPEIQDKPLVRAMALHTNDPVLTAGALVPKATAGEGEVGSGTLPSIKKKGSIAVAPEDAEKASRNLSKGPKEVAAKVTSLPPGSVIPKETPLKKKGKSGGKGKKQVAAPAPVEVKPKRVRKPKPVAPVEAPKVEPIKAEYPLGHYARPPKYNAVGIDTTGSEVDADSIAKSSGMAPRQTSTTGGWTSTASSPAIPSETPVAAKETKVLPQKIKILAIKNKAGEKVKVDNPFYVTSVKEDQYLFKTVCAFLYEAIQLTEFNAGGWSSTNTTQPPPPQPKPQPPPPPQPNANNTNTSTNTNTNTKPPKSTGPTPKQQANQNTKNKSLAYHIDNFHRLHKEINQARVQRGESELSHHDLVSPHIGDERLKSMGLHGDTDLTSDKLRQHLTPKEWSGINSRIKNQHGNSLVPDSNLAIQANRYRSTANYKGVGNDVLRGAFIGASVTKPVTSLALNTLVNIGSKIGVSGNSKFNGRANAGTGVGRSALTRMKMAAGLGYRQ